MVRSLKAQTMEVLPTGWLQSLGFRSVPFPRPIPRFNSRNFFQWGRREQKVDGVTVYVYRGFGKNVRDGVERGNQ
ncbi:hypothetical protein COLO4_02765 [Corchorus olitorius]|uniref:Uncharacterized protein n=1 Tax=Corchorus olitorius TaxID=93759 RepID=A0A1R3L0C6_9ROSI|nr:hypothetical protein COLO4_02765 [Corchorus olitorius]